MAKYRKTYPKAVFLTFAVVDAKGEEPWLIAEMEEASGAVSAEDQNGGYLAEYRLVGVVKVRTSTMIHKSKA